jgi:hypothetical protein
MKCRDSKPQILKRLFIPSTNTHTHTYIKIDSLLVLLFFYAITKQKKVNHNFEIFETFKLVRINITSLDVIK